MGSRSEWWLCCAVFVVFAACSGKKRSFADNPYLAEDVGTAGASTSGDAPSGSLSGIGEPSGEAAPLASPGAELVPATVAPCVGGACDAGIGSTGAAGGGLSANGKPCDGSCNSMDPCPGSDNAADGDGDGVPDACDVCASGDDAQDADTDGVPDACDRCAGAPESGPNAGRISGVVVSSPNMGTCCGGGFEALVDGSGLGSTTMQSVAISAHDCDDANRWSSNPPALAGELDFEFPGPSTLGQLIIWNSGQTNGERGVREISVEVSDDGVEYAPVFGQTIELAQGTCPSRPEILEISPPVVTRHVRFSILGSYSTGGATSTGIGEVWFACGR